MGSRGRRPDSGAEWFVHVHGSWQSADERTIAEWVQRGWIERGSYVRHVTWPQPAPIGWVSQLQHVFQVPVGPASAAQAGAPASAGTSAGDWRVGQQGYPIASSRAKPAGSSFLDQFGPWILLAAGFFFAGLFTLASGWFGIIVGIAFAVRGELGRRGKLRSLTEFVLNRPVGKYLGMASMAVGLLFTTCGGARLVGEHQVQAAKDRREREAEERKRAEAEREEKRRAGLEAQIPAKVERWRATLREVEKMAAAANFANGGVDKVDAVRAEKKRSEDELGHPTPQSLTAFDEEIRAAQLKYEERADFDEALKGMDEDIAKGKKHAANRRWLDADGEYKFALAKIGAVEEAKGWLRQHVPSDFDAPARRREVDALRRSIAGPVAAERKRVEREERERAKELAKLEQARAVEEAYRALCGPKPELGPWDGELPGLESVIARTAHDPDSIDVENCTPPVLSPEDCWISTCSVRGKNMFGAMILQRRTFSYSKALGYRER